MKINQRCEAMTLKYTRCTRYADWPVNVKGTEFALCQQHKLKFDRVPYVVAAALLDERMKRDST